jgi:hypothetical protein
VWVASRDMENVSGGVLMEYFDKIRLEAFNKI